MLIEELRLTNLLSFGSHPDPITLGPLNLFIGPNGSGKSNLIEAIDLLRHAPGQLSKPIREGGGVRDWLWKGASGIPVASLDVMFAGTAAMRSLRHVISFTEVAQRLQIVDERIENSRPDPGHTQPYFYYRYQNGQPVLNVKGTHRGLRQETVDTGASILSQRRDPDQYPEITALGDALRNIRIYRDWGFGRYTAPRLPQKTDLPTEFLEPDGSNLGLVLNSLRRDPNVKVHILAMLQILYDGIEDFDVQVEGNTIQVFLQERRFIVPATRLSDGTLRFLCLLTILSHPRPPPLICIEEPELGLHPDILGTVADLLRQASERCQVIVTTHSDVLVDAMTETPECVVVCEKQEGATHMRRLSQTELEPWLEKYRLGELWRRGDIGGNRW